MQTSSMQLDVSDESDSFPIVLFYMMTFEMARDCCLLDLFTAE